MAKNDTAPGCAGTACNDDTCLACQVAQAKNAHADIMAVLKSLDGHLSDLTLTIDNFRKAYVGGGRAPVEAGVAAIRPPKTEAAKDLPKAEPTLETPKLTIDNVRPRVLEWIKAHGRDAFVAVLGKFGASKLPDVKEADLPALMLLLEAGAAAGK